MPPPRHNQPPGRTQMAADAGVANEGLEEPCTLVPISALPGSKDLLKRSAKRSVILIQQDTGRARRGGVGQSDDRGRAQGIAARLPLELLPRASTKPARCEGVQEQSNHLAPAMAMDFHPRNRPGPF